MPGRQWFDKHFQINYIFTMRQKYFIKRDFEQRLWTIQEFVDSERIPRTGDPAKANAEDFVMIGSHTYNDDDIQSALQAGGSALMQTLRSQNFYPVQACANLLADSIQSLFSGTADSAATIVFDDMALLRSSADEDKDIEAPNTP